MRKKHGDSLLIKFLFSRQTVTMPLSLFSAIFQHTFFATGFLAPVNNFADSLCRKG
jgi:hypothetical protein